MSLLHVAASGGFQKLAVSAIAMGADLALKNEDFLGACTPLHIAASYGQEAICRFILARGGDCNEPNEDGHTSMQLAKMGGHEQVAEKLLSWGKKQQGVGLEEGEGIPAGKPKG